MLFGFDDFELDAERLELRRSGELVRADAAVLRLLAALVSEAGQLVTKRELIARVWDGRAVSENVISVAVARLRKLLRNEAGEREFVVNLHGRGYRFVCPVKTLGGALAPILSSLGAVGPREHPFVGRASELARVRAAMEDARRGRGNICLISGEPGIGKTRVAEQLAREAAETKIPTTWGYCHEAGDTPPLWPWAQLARDLLDALPADDDQTRAAAATPELAWLLATSSNEAAGAEAKPAAKHRIFDAFLTLFKTAARATPCVLILEDLHRADAATLELLRYCVDPIARTRILLLGTMRRAESRQAVSSADLGYVIGHRNSTRIELERLSVGDVTAYVSALVEDHDGRLGDAVFAKSEGNPFFMTELGRQLATRTSPEGLTVPGAALELVRPRVLEVDAAAGGVLRVAAVIGRSFTLKLLADALECDTDADADAPAALTQGPQRRQVGHTVNLMAVLDRAVEAEILVQPPASRTTFAFGHELLRAVLYEALAPAARRELHLCVARAIERQRQHGGLAVTAVLAYHHHAALPAGDLRHTVAVCRTAADEAGHVFAYADGALYLAYALEALALLEAPSPRLRMALLLRQAIYSRIAALSKFEALVRELTRLARDQGDGAIMAHAGRLLDLHPGLPALAHAHEVFHEALSMLGPDDDEARGMVLARLATGAPLAFDESESAATLERALALALHSGSVSTISAARSAELYLFGGPLHETRESETLRESERLCRAHPQLLSVPPVLLDLHRAIRALQRGKVSDMHAALGRAHVRCRKLGSHELLWHVERCQALAKLAAQRADAVDELRALHARARSLELVASELLCLYDELVVLGDAPTGRTAREVLTGEASDPPNVWSIKVRVLAAAGFRDDARALLHSVPAPALARLPCDRDHLGTLGLLARAALNLDEPAYIAALHDALARYPGHFAAHVSFWCEGSTTELVGELGWALGRHDQAKAQLAAGAAHCREVGLLSAAERAERALSALDASARE